MLLRVNVFRGIQNIPNVVAERRGLFAKWGIEIETRHAESSNAQRRELADGVCDIAHSAVDNALAMAAAGVDAVIVMGGDRGFNKLVVRPGIASVDDLRGRVFGVDAPDTAFALLGYEMLRCHGLERDRDYEVRVVGATPHRLRALKEGNVDFALLNLPFNLLAQDAGLSLLADPLDVVGPYQGTGAFVMRRWAAANAEVLERYVAACVEGLRWAAAPSHRAELAEILHASVGLEREMAARCQEIAFDTSRGFFPDAAIDEAGMARVIELRTAFAAGPVRPAPDWVDTSFHARAVSYIDRGGRRAPNAT